MRYISAITINSANYFLADDLKDLYPESFIGARTTREYIKKRKVPNGQYIFARKSDGEWQQSDGKSNRVDKVFLRQSYAEANIIPAQNASSDNDGHEQTSPHGYILSGDEHTAPIILADEEKFRDSDGNMYDVDIRGQRHYKRCYFRLSDISILFDMNNLRETVLHKGKGYKKCIDYVILLLHADDCNKISSKHINNSKPKKTLFLTYSGLLRAIFASKSGNAHRFIDWASKIVYTAHMGTKPQRQKGAARLIGTFAKNVKAIFDRSLTGLAFVYLLRLGPVSQLRQKLGIGPEHGDDDIVYKYGRTDDLARQMKEHDKKYGTTCAVEYYINIDPKFSAEASFARFIKGMGIHHDHKKHNELCIISASSSPSILGRIKDNMAQMNRAYMGTLAEAKAEKDRAIAESEKAMREKIEELRQYYQAKIDEKDEQYAKERAELMHMLEDERGRVTKLMDKLISREA